MIVCVCVYVCRDTERSAISDEFAEQFPDQNMPTPELKYWVSYGMIECQFYETLTTKTVLHAKTALSGSTKFLSLSQDVDGMLLNTSRRIKDCQKIEVLAER